MADHCDLVSVNCSDHHERLTSGLWNLLKSSGGVDYSVRPGGGEKQIQAHRLILGVFLSPEKLAQLAEFSGDVCMFNTLLEFLYTGKVSVPRKDLVKLLVSARASDFQMLVDALETLPTLKPTESRSTNVPKADHVALQFSRSIPIHPDASAAAATDCDLEIIEPQFVSGDPSSKPSEKAAAPPPGGPVCHQQFDVSRVKLEPRIGSSQCNYETMRSELLPRYSGYSSATDLQVPTDFGVHSDGGGLSESLEDTDESTPFVIDRLSGLCNIPTNPRNNSKRKSELLVRVNDEDSDIPEYWDFQVNKIKVDFEQSDDASVSDLLMPEPKRQKTFSDFDVLNEGPSSTNSNAKETTPGVCQRVDDINSSSLPRKVVPPILMLTGTPNRGRCDPNGRSDCARIMELEKENAFLRKKLLLEQENASLLQQFFYELPKLFKKVDRCINLFMTPKNANTENHDDTEIPARCFSEVELYPNSGVFLKGFQLEYANMSSTPSAFIGTLLPCLFSQDVLLASNYGGGKSKIDPSQPTRPMLDKTIMDGLRLATIKKYPAFTKENFGIIINRKLGARRRKINA